MSDAIFVDDACWMPRLRSCSLIRPIRKRNRAWEPRWLRLRRTTDDAENQEVGSADGAVGVRLARSRVGVREQLRSRRSPARGNVTWTVSQRVPDASRAAARTVQPSPGCPRNPTL